MPVKRAYPIAVRRGSVTVKIYRQKSADVFTVAFYEHGQRQRLSFRDEGEARKAADEVADRLSRHNGASLTLAGTDLVEYCQAQECLHPLGVRLDIAASEYSQAMSLLGGRATLIEAARRDRREWRP